MSSSMNFSFSWWGSISDGDLFGWVIVIVHISILICWCLSRNNVMIFFWIIFNFKSIGFDLGLITKTNLLEETLWSAVLFDGEYDHIRNDNQWIAFQWNEYILVFDYILFQWIVLFIYLFSPMTHCRRLSRS